MALGTQSSHLDEPRHPTRPELSVEQHHHHCQLQPSACCRWTPATLMQKQTAQHSSGYAKPTAKVLGRQALSQPALPICPHPQLM